MRNFFIWTWNLFAGFGGFVALYSLCEPLHMTGWLWWNAAMIALLCLNWFLTCMHDAIMGKF